MSEDLKKWACPRCTYENWPRSRRCTLCSLSRNLPRSAEAEESPRVESSNSKLLTGGWSCPSCTFDNWVASGTCIQCGTTSPFASSSKQPCTDFSPPSSSLTSLGVVKWICPSCTYENWPKSRHCVMCKALPPSSSPTPSSPPATALGQLDWISACKAVVTGDSEALHKLLTSNSHDLSSHHLTSQDCQTLERWCAGECGIIRPGISLLDLARAFNRTEWINSLSALFPSTSQGRPNVKRSVCQASACAAKELRYLLDRCVRQRRGLFNCSYLTEFGTFYLPSEVRELPGSVQDIMIRELCDTEAQNELEVRSKVINWWVVDGKQNQPTSRLLALWNRTDGDCLLDSIMQACWGVFDQQSTLRHALFKSIRVCEKQFYQIWREHEVHQAASQYRPDDEQLLRDWRSALKAASLTRSPLEQIHIFVLAHVLRRPIIVYSVKYIHNCRDEPIGLANFEGVYLPLLWESAFCHKNPVVLGYTRGHFTALVPTEPSCNFALSTSLSASFSPDKSAPLTDSTGNAACSSNADAPFLRPDDEVEGGASTENSEVSHLNSIADRSIYLPLFDRHGTPLPVPFAPKNSAALTDTQLLRDRLETMFTRRGLLLARLRLPARRHYLVEDIVTDWLLVYRRMAASATVPTASATGASGGNDSDTFHGVEPCE